jgi:hypothetical protein
LMLEQLVQVKQAEKKTRKEAEMAKKKRKDEIEKEKERRKEPEKKRKKDENDRRKEAEKKRDKDHVNEKSIDPSDEQSSNEKASRTSNSHQETPQVGGDTRIQGPTKTRTTESRLTLEGTTVIYPEPELPKGEMLVAPCCLTKFEEPSSRVKFRALELSPQLKVYVCDYIPVKHLEELTSFHDSSCFQKTCKEEKKKILPYDVRTSVEENKKYHETNKAAYGSYFPYLDKGLAGKKFRRHAGLKGAHTTRVENFMNEVSKGLNEVTGKQLLNGALEIHGFCIETVEPAHQRGHIDHALSYEVDKRSFVGHMPLDQEGIVLRLENISSGMRQCLLQKEANLVDKFEVVDHILYIHVPFGSILVIDDRTFHGGHYGSPGVKRFHFVVSPRKWQDQEGDSLLFLREAARHHTKKWKDKTGEWKCGGWEEKDDPKVAEPNLPIDKLNQMIKKIDYHRRNTYYESFLEQCYPQSTLDHLKRVSNLIPDYKPQVLKDILSSNAKALQSPSDKIEDDE